jgi:hypothetical protein
VCYFFQSLKAVRNERTTTPKEKMWKQSAADKTKAANRCKILWGAKGGKAAEKSGKVLTDKSWAYSHHHETLGLVTVSAKAGNRALALENYSEEQKTKISSNLLRKKYRYIDLFFSPVPNQRFVPPPLSLSLVLRLRP